LLFTSFFIYLFIFFTDSKLKTQIQENTATSKVSLV